MTAALIVLSPAVVIALLVAAAVRYRPTQPPAAGPDPCPIHALPCPNPTGCVAVYQAECAAHGLPLLATGSDT